jgi:uncharacterized protein (TIGR02594 family)
MITISAFQLAQRFIGMKEIAGAMDNPQIMAMLKLDNAWPQNDEVPWCSAFVNYIAWLLRLPRSKDLRARSWLGVGEVMEGERMVADSDIVILNRNNGPGPEVLNAPGHVGFFAGWNSGKVMLLAGNQGNMVSVQSFDVKDILGLRRLA